MKNNNLFLTLAKYSLLLLVFTPFIVDHGVFFPYIEGKTVFLRAVVVITFLLLVFFLLFTKRREKELFLGSKLKLLKNPISLFVALFLFSFAISAFFAKDSYRAFFGDVERGEGFVGHFFFVSIFFLALLLFERREWRLFFAGVLASGVVFFIQEIFQLNKANWDIRPFATFGNPSFLAGYFLFVIFAQFALFSDVLNFPFAANSKRKNALLAGFLLLLFVPIVGILLTQTRGTLLGLFVGITTVFLFLGTRFLFLKFPARRPQIALALMLLLAFLGGVGGFVFQQVISGKNIATIASSVPFVPEKFVDRLFSSDAFQTRWIAAKVSVNSIIPRNEGVLRFLFGWGPDNYKIAYNTYFDPRYFLYEDVWFDRAHNRLLDAFVMEGFVGLLIFLALWGSSLLVSFRALFSGAKGERNSFEKREDLRGEPYSAVARPQNSLSSLLLVSSPIFFAVSYLVHDLFLFDTVTSHVAIFFFFAFMCYQFGGLTQKQVLSSEQKISQRTIAVSHVFLMVWTIVAAVLFLWATWMPYLQMHSYIKLKTGGLTLKEFTAKLESVLYPYTYVQDRIRTDLVKSLPSFEGGEGIGRLFGKSFEAMDELISREPYEPRYPMIAGQMLEEISDDIRLLGKSEEYYRKAVALVPNRPDLIYLLGQNLLMQGRFEEGKEVLEGLLRVAPDVPLAKFLYSMAFASVIEKYPEKELLMLSFENLESVLKQEENLRLNQQKLSVVRELYEFYMYRFYLVRDKENFWRALVTAKQIEEQWEKTAETEFRQGKRSEPLTFKKSEQMAKLLEVFPTMGWDAVRLEKRQ